jgi:hypothetical protein
MSKYGKLIQRILSGAADGNIEFEDLRQLLVRMGFEERVRGSHHIYARVGVDEIINIQPIGAKAKRYQVKQVREMMLKYRMGGTDV